MIPHSDRPRGELSTRQLAMPRDTNPRGDIFGGWLLAQMDVSGSLVAVRRAAGRVVTVGVEAMAFHRPVNVGDVLSCYAEIIKVGRTSITVRVEAWAEKQEGTFEAVKVTEGNFTYVAIDAQGNKRHIPQEGSGPYHPL
ncbi:MAG: acyl-CoA thioesterase [Magnetospirillum sp. WYHS-4]